MHTNLTWKDWLVFSKKERTIVVALTILLAGCFAFTAFYQPKVESIAVENLNEKIAQLSSGNTDSAGFRSSLDGSSANSFTANNSSAELFYFDPNILDEAGFAKLGLREKTAHTIINYRSKGGHFYKPDDLRKIYGLKEEEANRLVPYVRIASSQNNHDFYDSYTSNTKDAYHKKKPQIIDINTATADQWQSLPAIGEVLSSRIVKYRDKIGGFASVSDVKKVYGISDSTYNVILPYLSFSGKKINEQTTIQVKSSSQKININKVTAAELKANPDIPSDIAEAIIIYRKQHGNYTSVQDIKKIVFINEAMYQKIAPYLSIE